MKDVIERMLKVEEEARTILGEARKRSEETTEKSRREASDQAEKLRAGAHAEAVRLIEQSREEMKKRRAERVAAIDKADADYAESVRPGVAPAVERVVKRVVGEGASG
jgi:F0F1-type ATP synthase membrane subunit b/b'